MLSFAATLRTALEASHPDPVARCVFVQMTLARMLLAAGNLAALWHVEDEDGFFLLGLVANLLATTCSSSSDDQILVYTDVRPQRLDAGGRSFRNLVPTLFGPRWRERLSDLERDFRAVLSDVQDFPDSLRAPPQLATLWDRFACLMDDYVLLISGLRHEADVCAIASG